MRAILLAAGMGTRLRPLTLETPKSLIKVNDTPLLERQIEFLKEKGIDEIIVVTGYLSEKFEYLKEKYGIKLVHNNKYDIYNNIYTMYLVREYLEDAYVIDADVYIVENFILENPETSLYFSAYKEGFKEEWRLYFNEELRVEDIKVESGEGNILSGVSFWSKKDTPLIVKELENTIEKGDFKNMYWDDIVKNNISRLNIYVRKIGSEAIFEIDNLEELEFVKNKVEK